MGIRVDELLTRAKAAGLEPLAQTGYFKIGPPRGPRVYVRPARPDALAKEIHLSEFTLDDPRIGPPGPRLGRVQGIARIPARCDEAARAAWFHLFDTALAKVNDGRQSAADDIDHRAIGHGHASTIPEHVLSFVGYGSPEAPLWFVGLEEGFGRRLAGPRWTVQAELDARAAWSPIMDAREAHRSLRDEYWLRRDYTPVWRNAAKLARALVEGASDWRDTNLAHEYVVHSLGQSHGRTFLGDLFPLPAIGLHHWPYSRHWPSRDAYRKAIWPDRLALWRAMLSRSPKNTVLICYGTSARAFAGEAFDVWERKGLVAETVNGRRIILSRFIDSRIGDRGLSEIVDAARSG